MIIIEHVHFPIIFNAFGMKLIYLHLSIPIFSENSVSIIILIDKKNRSSSITPIIFIYSWLLPERGLITNNINVPFFFKVAMAVDSVLSTEHIVVVLMDHTVVHHMVEAHMVVALAMHTN